LPDNITETDISYIFKKVINYNGNTISYIVKCFELGNYAIELISGYKSQAEKVHLIKQREQWEKSLLKTKNPIYVDEIKDTIKSINKRIITLVN
ncbi:MAG: hypothetical protein GY756_15455, partial [bacterium]|nr:hypothetical protein [bacterium]